MILQQQGVVILFRRVLFAVKYSLRYRNRLREFQRDAALQVPTPLELDLNFITKEGIAILALDLDGVLVAYGEVGLTEPMVVWLKRCIAVLTAERIFIYSNKPSEARKDYFSQNFPGLRFVEGARKKPYPEGFYQIMKKANVQANEILLLDDRLLTGILAALIAGARAKWVTKPIISMQKRPLSELFFIMLRLLERILFR